MSDGYDIGRDLERLEQRVSDLERAVSELLSALRREEETEETSEVSEGREVDLEE